MQEHFREEFDAVGAVEAGRDVMFTGAHEALSLPVLVPYELSDVEAADKWVWPSSSSSAADAQMQMTTCPAGEMVFPWMFEDFAALRPFKVSLAWPVNVVACGPPRY